MYHPFFVCLWLKNSIFGEFWNIYLLSAQNRGKWRHKIRPIAKNFWSILIFFARDDAKLMPGEVCQVSCRYSNKWRSYSGKTEGGGGRIRPPRRWRVMTSHAIHICRNDYSDVETMIFIEIRFTLVGSVSFSWQPPRQCYILLLWPCLTSLWHYRSIKYGQGVAEDHIMWYLLTAVWIFTIRPLVREIHQALLWLVNIDPSYDVTSLRNMFNWPPL